LLQDSLSARRGDKVVNTGCQSGKSTKYADIAGFCKSATIKEIAAHGYVLTPGRYFAAKEVEDDGEPFLAMMKRVVES